MVITLFFWLVANAGNCMAQQHITIIEPQNIPAELLVKTIKAQLSDTSSVTVFQNKLILNANEQELENIRQLIDRIDAPGRQLLISLKKTGSDHRTGKEGGITVQHGKNPLIKTGKNPIFGADGKTTTTVTVKQQISNQSGTSDQNIRATEGIPVFISTGNSLLATPPRANAGRNPAASQEWVSAGSGFNATVWLNGNSVTVKIDQQDNHLENSTTISNQQLQTQVNGQAGQWMPIGTINEQGYSASRQLNSSAMGKAESFQTIYLKVEPLD